MSVLRLRGSAVFFPLSLSPLLTLRRMGTATMIGVFKNFATTISIGPVGMCRQRRGRIWLYGSRERQNGKSQLYTASASVKSVERSDAVASCIHFFLRPGAEVEVGPLPTSVVTRCASPGMLDTVPRHIFSNSAPCQSQLWRKHCNRPCLRDVELLRRK